MVPPTAAQKSNGLNLGPLPTCRALVLLVIGILVVYANSFNCGWHYDDNLNIQANPAIQIETLDVTTLWAVIKDGDQQPGQIGRPLAYLSFALNYLVGGLSVVGYHVVNVCIHILAAITLFFLIRLILNLPRFRSTHGHWADAVALLAVFFWALHPLNVTAVTYIVQRMASMAALFYLLAMYAYLRGRLTQSRASRVAFFGVTVLATLASMASKENAFMLPISLLAIEFYLIQRPGWQLPNSVKIMALTIVVAITGYVIYQIVFQDLFAAYEKRYFTMWQRLLTQPRILLFYVSLIVYPTNSRLMLLHDPGISVHLFSPWTTLTAILILGLSGGFAIGMCRRYPLASFSVLFFLLNHLIESSFVPLELIYEHRNYLPMVFLSMLMAKGILHLHKYFQNSRLVYPLLVGATILMLVNNGHSTHLYNEVFKTDLSLWHDNAQKSPALGVVQNNYGNILMGLGKLEEARVIFEKALQNNRFNNTYQIATIYYNLGRVYEAVEGSGSGKAIEAYREALNRSPGYHSALFRMAAHHQREGRFNEAERLLRKAIDHGPSIEHPSLKNGLSLAQLKLGKHIDAYRNASVVLQLKPLAVAPRAVLAEIHRQRGQYHQAVLLWEAVLKLQPDHMGAHLALAELWQQMGEPARAIPHLRKVVGLRPKLDFETIISEVEATASIVAWSHDLGLIKEVYGTFIRSAFSEIEVSG